MAYPPSSPRPKQFTSGLNCLSYIFLKRWGYVRPLWIMWSGQLLGWIPPLLPVSLEILTPRRLDLLMATLLHACPTTIHFIKWILAWPLTWSKVLSGATTLLQLSPHSAVRGMDADLFSPYNLNMQGRQYELTWGSESLSQNIDKNLSVCLLDVCLFVCPFVCPFVPMGSLWEYKLLDNC